MKTNQNESMNIDELLKRLADVQQLEPNRFRALCPAHTDRVPSLSISIVDGEVILDCFAGCSHEKIIRAIGLGKSN